MRLIATLQDEKQSLLLSNYLKSQNIDNIVDISINNNWGDTDYGVPKYTIWVIEEENLIKALDIVKDFASESNKSRFQNPMAPSKSSKTPDLYELTPEAIDTKKESVEEEELPLKSTHQESHRAIDPLGKVTLYLLMLCSLVFLFCQINEKNPSQYEVAAFSNLSLPLVPLYYSQLEKELLFDYPHAYEIVDSIIAKIDNETLQDTKQLPSDIRPLIRQFESTPYWQGFYGKIVSFFQNKNISWEISAPLFEKIRQGEVWRIISPIFLHADIFHLLFNMIWLGLLGRQLESRMGWKKYLLFVFLAGIITNICQYLMTGSNFLGFSGVICAMITFVWIRQQKAPWEGYLLQSATFNFALLFLFVILVLQLASFYTEIAYNQPIAPQIANTAHMAGLFLGFLFGSFNFFAWNTNT